LFSIAFYLQNLITHRVTWPNFTLLLLSLVAMNIAKPAKADTQWPVTEFEIFEGLPWGSSNWYEANLGRKLGRHTLETKTPASVPLTAAIKKEMETYLHQVALKMQKLDLPAPYLEPVITRDDGTQVFRIYYFDFSKANNSDPADYAVAAYACKDETAQRRIIKINASRLVSAKSGGITDKGYVDLAHELFHSVQRGSQFYDANCEPPNWLTEGMAEAIGTDIAVELRQAKPTQLARWGLRHYYERLAVDGNASVNPARAHSYATSSFWRYLAELAHYRKSLIPSERWPQASVSSRRYGVDYKYVSRLLNSAETLPDQKEILDFLNNFLLADPAFNMRLSSIYPVFAATFANYGLERVIDDRDAKVMHNGWIKKAFGECPIITLDASNTVGRAQLSLNRITGRCVHINIGAISAPTTIMDISTLVPNKAIGAQLYLGTAGGKSVAQAIVKTAGAAGYTASWDPLVQAGDSFDLVFTNIADKPRATLLVDLIVQFSLPGSSNDQVSPTPQSVKKQKKQNKNQQGVTETVPDSPPQSSGSTTVSTSCSDEVPEQGCGWPASEFNGYCGPSMNIDLQTLPVGVANMSMMGSPLGLMNQVFNTVAGFMGPDNNMSNMPDASEFDGLRVSIGLPLPTFGESVSYSNAAIHVDGGGWPNSGSYGPRDILSGSQTYFAPSGLVVLEEYSALLLRGSYEAQLVALPTPYADKANFMELPIIGTLKGSFLIPRPCGKGIDDEEEVEIDRQRFIQDVMTNFVPNNMLIPSDTTENTRPSQSNPTSAFACDCSCSGMLSSTAILDKLEGAPDGKTMTLAMCMLTCATQYQQCDEE
jgi:hypothetical protein